MVFSLLFFPVKSFFITDDIEFVLNYTTRIFSKEVVVSVFIFQLNN